MSTAGPAPDGATHVRAYVDEPVGDVAAATTAARFAAAQFGLPQPRVLRVSMNAVFVAGDAVLRVARPSVPAEVSLELARFLERIGIRVALPARDDVVRLAGLQVTCWHRLRPVAAPVDWVDVGGQVRRVWAVDPDDLPRGLPRPRPGGFPWWRLDAILDELRGAVEAIVGADEIVGLDDVGEVGASCWRSMREVVAANLHRLEPDPCAEVVCHGDVHPGNVVVTDEGPALVDWDLVCLAPPVWDHTALMRWAEVWGGAPGAYEAFAAGAGGSVRGDPDAEGIAELRLVAAAAMAVRRALAAPDDIEALDEARRRLQRWRPGATPEVWRAR